MIKCTFHPHSSDKTAIECRVEFVRKRADRRLERSGVIYKRTRLRQNQHSPPKKEVKNGIEIFIFYDAKPI